MRLEKIKLAGFKSFVDPTTVTFPSNLVGVVGPNGCGKSNVIDAVRWVMGESSAKMLRGESMADVIFNGSTSRKPVGTASIELLFDNADGAAGGQYAQYGQISVKRQVSRDGQSSYFLNGVRCRRRDIADLFLGTGLGPRSYSIIEQGMISRVIEARPEELRSYLEEAAGISKYKERRRETERRIEHTRENLDRLNDLREEVSKQLRHLERQAATAERYKTLKEEERQTKGELLALRWRALDGELAGHDRQIAEQENRLQKAIAGQRHIEVQIEQGRAAHADAQDAFNGVQSRFYQVGSDIARLEEALQYARESRRKQESDLARADQALRDAQQHRSTDQDRLDGLTRELAEHLPRLQGAEGEVEAATTKLDQADAAMSAWQAEWDSFNQQAAEPAQLAQVERTRINHLESRETELRRRLQRLREEHDNLSDEALHAEIVQLTESTRGAVEQRDGLAQRLLNHRQNIEEIRERGEQGRHRLDELRSELETARGRLSSLQTLQEEALGQRENPLTKWLEHRDLAAARRVAQTLQVDPEWQGAVEQVLAGWLQGVIVDDVDAHAAELAALGEGELALIESDPAEPVADDSLAATVRGPRAIQARLARVFKAADLVQALARRGQLSADQSVVTPDGIWLGPDWIILRRGGGATSGVLAREQELRDLQERLVELEPLVEAIQAELQKAGTELADAEEQRDQLQAELDGAQRDIGERQARLSALQARAEQIRQRRESLATEAAEVKAQVEIAAAEMAEARERLHAALAAVEQASGQREALVARRETLRRELTTAREHAHAARVAAHEIALRVESMRSSEASLRTGIDRVQDQLTQLRERAEELRAAMLAAEEPLAAQQAELQEKLNSRVGVEKELADALKGMESLASTLREHEQGRGAAEQQVQVEREALDGARLARQEVAVRAKTLQESMEEGGYEREALLSELPEDAELGEWQQRMERLTMRIQRLGPINLAAIDEFKEQSERMEYLDAQYADITESLETLETAIRKIDRETRTRFKETFDKVNAGLKEMFPKLFGGGHAYLELTGEDLLDAGVSVMARPPGKRNASIHLLSGGEKALSAVALVFSIFQLNPAPFCMLDEVDAPLDDANVGRFCRMVQEMSEQVQFIFITHNKITMEIAHHLTGVTMHEPGVSRLVSVDVDEAAQLAAV